MFLGFRANVRRNGRHQRNGLANGRDTNFALNTSSVASMAVIWVADVVSNSVTVHRPTGIIWPVEQSGDVGPCPPYPLCRERFGHQRIHLLRLSPGLSQLTPQSSGIGPRAAVVATFDVTLTAVIGNQTKSTISMREQIPNIPLRE